MLERTSERPEGTRPVPTEQHMADSIAFEQERFQLWRTAAARAWSALYGVRQLSPFIIEPAEERERRAVDHCCP